MAVTETLPNIDLKDYIRTVPNWPIEGVMFRDVTTLLSEPAGMRKVINDLSGPHVEENINKVAALDARGFLFGQPVALQLDVGLVPLRKAGKLPYDTISETYDLEYGENVTLEMHTDAISEGDRVLLIDDLLATGGTAEAAVKLIRRMGGEVVRAGFVVDLSDLGGAERLRALGVPILALVAYDGE